MAAAMAAGETPSPEMVAAAGAEGLVHTRLGLACLGGVVAGLVLACWLAQSTYRVNRAGIDRHPEAMAADARRIIEGLGYSAKAEDWAFGYTDQGDDGLHFFYRQSPQPLTVFDSWTSFNKLSYGEVVEANPRWEVPGELGVRLSPRGELVSFRAIGPPIPDPQLAGREPEWTKWFPAESLGFDLDRLEKTADRSLRPPDPYDHLQVWRGTGPQTNEFYVEAAAYNGRPVYFDVLEPSRFAAAAPEVETAPWVMSWMYMGVTVGAAILAWRNFHMHRSDRRGAFRVAFYFFGIGLVVGAIQAHHSLGLVEGGVFEMGVAQAASRAIVFWLWYTALDPYVRRLWPQSLISWTRLLDGRWRDPLVGRDLLMGCLFGLAMNLVRQVHLLTPQWLSRAMLQFQSSPGWTLGGPGSLFADCLFKQIEAVFFAMFLLMSLLLLRLAFRRMLWASVAFVVLFATMTAPTGVVAPWIDWLAGAVGIGLTFWVLVQWGFLASVVSLLCMNLLTFPLTIHVSAWYAPHGLVGAGLVGSIAFLGFLSSSDNRFRRRPDPIAARPG